MRRKRVSGQLRKVLSTFAVACLLLLLTGFVRHVGGQGASAAYYPGEGNDWERRRPEEVGLHAARLAGAVAFAEANETAMPTDLRRALEERFSNDPYGEIVGPMKERGGTAGMIVRHGYIVAAWGDTRRVDMTFSVTKSYLSTLLGLALDRGLVKDVRDLVGNYVQDGGYDSEHNVKITWHHLAQQTSEWEGTLFGKPDAADRRRGRDRELQVPGTFWEYNDVRVNRFALSLLRVWRKPLPQVLKEEIMEPIGASDTWQWPGYDNANVEVNGRTMRSVSGGGHWGDGLFINTRDHARFGLLFLRRGKWGDRHLISENWIDRATTPCTLMPTYGYMWWLNTGQRLWSSAPESSYAARGFGGNMIWVDPEHDLVVVTRWLDQSKHDEFLQRVLAAVQ